MFWRMSNSNRPSVIAAVSAFVLTACVGASMVRGVGLTYVEADPENIFDPNVGPLTAFATASVDNDGLWGKRTDFGANSTVWQSGVTEDSPELTQTITGLNAGSSYDVYAVYWTDNDENWTIKTGLPSGALTTYSWTGAAGAFPFAGSVQGAPAALAAWDVPPPPGPAAVGTQLYTQRVTAGGAGFGTDDPTVMLLGKAGTAVADGSGNIQVRIDDNPGAGGANRVWFDGLAYKLTEAGALTATATLNRDTGALTLNNQTSLGRGIKAIRLESSTSGGLNGTTWTSVHSTNGAWTVTDPVDPSITPFATNLTENGGATTVNLAANGGSISFGNVWNRSPFEQLVIHLTLSDDTVAVLTPQVTGTAIVNGDLDGNGSINTADYQSLMTNLHTSIAGLTRVEGYRKGDMSGDGVLSFADFVAFRTAYDVANGAGAFAQMAAQVPEPGSVALCLVGSAIAICRSRRRRSMWAAACAFLLCLTAAGTTRAVPLLAVDFDDRETTGAEGTQAGFQSFLLSGTTASVSTPTTNVLDGYTVVLTPFDDLQDENNVTAGVQSTTGAVDDRDRATPVNAGALTYGQIYDDFIFAGASTGPTGGLDVSVSGGALLPNKAYNVSVYSYDSGSSGTRTANYYDATNAASPIFTTSWAGAAANNPTNNDQYKFSGIVQTNASGVLTVQGRNTTGYVAAGGVNPGVFLNALEINEFTGLTLEVNTTTGTTRVLNEQASSLSLGYYEIRSIAGALNPGGWNSLDDQESGDPVGTGWDEAGGSSANILSEGNLQGQSTIAPAAALTLGAAVNPAGAHDLRFFYAEFTDSALRAGFVKYISTGISGDYNSNGVVDAADYVVWRNTNGTSTTLPNDSTPGTVTQADYDVWKANFGKTPGSGSSLGDGGAVPEPATWLLGLATLVGLIASKRSR